MSVSVSFVKILRNEWQTVTELWCTAAAASWGQRLPWRPNIDMQMCPWNRKHVLMYRDMILKSNCNQNLTLQRQCSAPAAMTDNLWATTGWSFFMKKKKRKEKGKKKEVKTWTDIKRERKKKHGWPRWSCLGTERRRQWDEGRAREIHLYYVIKGKGEAGRPVTDRVM